KKGRVRTEEQLARKRHADRLNQKARREKDKNRIHRLEVDIETLRAEIRALRSVANTFPFPIQRPTSPLLTRPIENVEDDREHGKQRSSSPPLPRTELLQVLAASYSPAAISSAVRSVVPSGRRPLIVFCVCGIEHKSKSECLEYASYRILLRGHVALSNGTPAFTRLPRTPSLPHLLLQSTDDNPVIATIAPVFQRFVFPTIPGLFGLYILVYRLLRWRLYPDSQSYEDIPPWYRSSSLQETIPHIISIDYLPWPPLRDYLISNELLILGTTHSARKYIEAMRFSWPEGKDLILKSDGGGIVLNPEFESYVFSLENWKISRSWADDHPELVHLVNVED
ncbi:hypothetical protein K469DRAFT_438114, partial [Zopfia rhizophila CBS 207.26]